MQLVCYNAHNQFRSGLRFGPVSNERKIHLTKWQPPVWNFENIFIGVCHNGYWNC